MGQVKATGICVDSRGKSYIFNLFERLKRTFEQWVLLETSACAEA
jgi:hypothetical protein